MNKVCLDLAKDRDGGNPKSYLRNPSALFRSEGFLIFGNLHFENKRERIRMKSTTDFTKMKKLGEKIVMLTAYDHPSAQLAEEAGVDCLLVGDSLGMVVLGYESTAAVTVEDMIHHGKAVRRGAKETFVIVDMPFATYHGSADRTLES